MIKRSSVHFDHLIVQETEAGHAVFPSEVASGLLFGISGNFFDSEANYFSFSKMRMVSCVF